MEGEDTVTFYKCIKVIKANKIIAENENNPQFVVLDVRNPEDYRKDHIAKAVNIDFKSSDFSARLDNLNKTKTYLVVCYAGVRSKSTMQLMQSLHFSKVYSIKGE